MKNLKLELVEDWREFWKWSSVQWQIFLAAAIAATGHLPELLQNLPSLLMWIQVNWPDLLPILKHFFPSATQSDWIAVANLISIGLRMTQRKQVPQ